MVRYIMDPVIIDDVVTEEVQDRLYSVMTGQKMPWKFIRTTSVGAPEWYLDNDPKCKDMGQFTTQIYDDMNQDVGHPYPDFFLTPIMEAEQLLDITVQSIYRVKGNMLWKTTFKKDCYNIPHVDWPKVSDDENYDYLSAIYYLSDGDGDTILFKQNFDKLSSPTSIDDIEKNLEIEERIEPKKGRLLVFNSNRWHSSCNPKKSSYRWVINYIFKVKRT